MTEELGSSFAEFLSLGAVIRTFNVDGINIVQNFNSAEEYQTHNEPYFGETIGRVANRIAGGNIDHLNGKQYKLPVNNGPNCLHGGLSGWGKKVWDGPRIEDRHGNKAAKFQYVSPDGEEGFPGSLKATVWYVQRSQKGPSGEIVNELETEYEVELIGDTVDETVVAMTNHSYFNLTGDSTIEGTQVKLSTDLHLPVDENLIPTGEFAPYPGALAKEIFTLGSDEPDIDHCFVLNKDPDTISVDSRNSQLNSLATFYHPHSKINLEVHSTEPAFQFYTGKYIDVPAIGSLPARGKRSGFCVEPSRYINAVNKETWRKTVLLKKGEVYGCRTMYRAWRSK